MNGMWTFTTNENIGANGYFTDKGDISLRINEKKPLHFNLAGNINILKNSLDIKVSDFYLDASKFSKYFNSSYFSLLRSAGWQPGSVRCIYRSVS